MSDVIYGWLLILKKIKSNSIFSSQNLGMKYISFSPNNLKQNFGFLHAHIYCDVICRTIRLPLDFACCISIRKIWNYVKRYRFTKNSRSLKASWIFFKFSLAEFFLACFRTSTTLLWSWSKQKILKKSAKWNLKKFQEIIRKFSYFKELHLLKIKDD